MLEKIPTRQPVVKNYNTRGAALSAANDDLEEILALLDDYVGVSNTNMHLRAGAGHTARVLVPVPPEWRWMLQGRRSPWFPGFAVYCQRKSDWGPALGKLRADLQQAVSGKQQAVSGER